MNPSIKTPTYNRGGLILASLVIGSLIVIAVLGFAQGEARASAGNGLIVEELSGTLTATDLVNQLVGPGITVTNVTYSGAVTAAGTFTNGAGIVGFSHGIILSSGWISNVVGPNMYDDVSLVNFTPGDPDLEAFSGFTDTFDAAVLEFDFTPSQSGFLFRYVFSSDEYNEFVNTEFNDVFAFFVNGQNCATVNGQPVAINTVNNGNPFGTTPNSNPQLYINNDIAGGASINTEMDGLTVILSCSAFVNPGQTNHVKLAIADVSDSIYDSNVFLEAGSLTSFLPPRIWLPTVLKQ